MVFVEYLPRIKTTNVYTDFHEEIERIVVSNGSIFINDTPNAIKLTHNPNDFTFNVTQGPKGKIIKLKDNEIHNVEDADYHWSSKDLKTHNHIKCGSCEIDLVDITKLNKVLPMPSEMWHEMVDFWHCHKPNGSETMTKRFSGLRPGNNSVLVGAYYFLLNPENFDTIITDGTKIKCKQCGYELGDQDLNFGHHRILKWRVSLDEKHFEKWQYIYFQLLEETRFTGTHKFTVVCDEKYVKLWCFGAGIEAIIGDKKYKNGMKILYKEEEARKEDEHVIEVEYPETFDSFMDTLKLAGTEIAKYGLDTYADWNVTYLADRIESF